MEQQFREQQLFLVLSESERALLRSQSGLGRFSECFCCVAPPSRVQAFLPMWPSH